MLRLLSMVAFTTGIEFLVGFGYLSTRGVRLWDYSGHRFHYLGFICPEFSFYWLALSLLYSYLVLPMIVG